MKQNDAVFAFFSGAAVGVIIFVTILSVLDNPLSQGKAALAKCEESLPRNQICVITAVPDDRGKP